MSTSSSRIESKVHTTERTVHVVGGCPVGHDVARRLADRGLAVHLHDPEPSSDLPETLEVHDVPSLDAESFEGTGLGDDAILLAVNPADSTNLLLAQVARTRFGVDHVLARVNDPRRISAFEDAGIDTLDASAILGHAIADRC